MARVTVEDCLSKVENRFQLVMLATKRARQLALTATEPSVPWENDKATVVALREIAAGNITPDFLTEDENAHMEAPLSALEAAALKHVEEKHQQLAAADMDEDDEDEEDGDEEMTDPSTEASLPADDAEGADKKDADS